MPCLSLPLLPVPQLPSPLTLTLPSLKISLFPIDVKFCCHIFIPPPPLPYPLNVLPQLPPGVLNLSTINAMMGALDGVFQWIAKIGFDCPLD